jgi:hypothetical protein
VVIPLAMIQLHCLFAARAAVATVSASVASAWPEFAFVAVKVVVPQARAVVTEESVPKPKLGRTSEMTSPTLRAAPSRNVYWSEVALLTAGNVRVRLEVTPNSNKKTCGPGR